MASFLVNCFRASYLTEALEPQGSQVRKARRQAPTREDSICLALEAFQSAVWTAVRTVSIIVTIIIGISHTACYLLLVFSSLETFCL